MFVLVVRNDEAVDASAEEFEKDEEEEEDEEDEGEEEGDDVEGVVLEEVEFLTGGGQVVCEMDVGLLEKTLCYLNV